MGQVASRTCQEARSLGTSGSQGSHSQQAGKAGGAWPCGSPPSSPAIYSRRQVAAPRKRRLVLRQAAHVDARGVQQQGHRAAAPGLLLRLLHQAHGHPRLGRGCILGLAAQLQLFHRQAIKAWARSAGVGGRRPHLAGCRVCGGRGGLDAVRRRQAATTTGGGSGSGGRRRPTCRLPGVRDRAMASRRALRACSSPAIALQVALQVALRALGGRDALAGGAMAITDQAIQLEQCQRLGGAAFWLERAAGQQGSRSR